MRPTDDLTVEQTAGILGVSARRVRQFIGQGRLAARRFGPVYVVSRAAVQRFARLERPTGRPKVKSA